MLSFALMAKPLIVAERRGLMRPLFIGSIVLVLAAQLGLLLGGDTLLWMALWLLIFFTGFNILEASLPSLVSRHCAGICQGARIGHLQYGAGVGAVCRRRTRRRHRRALGIRSGVRVCGDRDGGLVVDRTRHA